MVNAKWRRCTVSACSICVTSRDAPLKKCRAGQGLSPDRMRRGSGCNMNLAKLGVKKLPARMRPPLSSGDLRAVKAIRGSILRVHRLQKSFVGGPPAHPYFQSRTNPRGDLRGHRAAKRRIERVPPLEKRFDHVQLVGRDPADLVSWSRGIDRRLLERPCQFDRLLVYDDRAGHEITKALILLAEKNAKDRDAIKKRQLIDDA